MGLFKIATKANTRTFNGTRTSDRKSAPLSFNIKTFKSKNANGEEITNYSKTFKFSAKFFGDSGIQRVGEAHKSIAYIVYDGAAYLTTHEGESDFGVSMKFSAEKSKSGKKSDTFTSTEFYDYLVETGLIVENETKKKFSLELVEFPIPTELVQADKDAAEFVGSVLETYKVSLYVTDSEEDEDEDEDAVVEDASSEITSSTEEVATASVDSEWL
jgi:hypothetical protein